MHIDVARRCSSSLPHSVIKSSTSLRIQALLRCQIPGCQELSFLLFPGLIWEYHSFTPFDSSALRVPPAGLNLSFSSGNVIKSRVIPGMSTSETGEREAHPAQRQVYRALEPLFRLFLRSGGGFSETGLFAGRNIPVSQNCSRVPPSRDFLTKLLIIFRKCRNLTFSQELFRMPTQAAGSLRKTVRDFKNNPVRDLKTASGTQRGIKDSLRDPEKH